MKKSKNYEEQLSWKLVWDSETKDVLMVSTATTLETENEIFESNNKNEIYDKIVELGLKYDPSIEMEFEW